MAYDLGLAQRVREALGQRPFVSERAMFGGLAFLVDGKMFVGISGDSLMARVGLEHYLDALAMPSVRPMDFTGRPMKGYVYLDPPALVDDHVLEAWVTWCISYVVALPTKAARTQQRDMFVLSSKVKAAAHSTSADTTAAVDDFMAQLDHPLKIEVQEIRSAILGVSAAIAEGIKWKAPSFRTHEYFATINLREKDGMGVILHLGAKVRDLGPGGLTIEDPKGLLKWLAPDRASVRFASSSDFKVKKAAFECIVRLWVRHV